MTSSDQGEAQRRPSEAELRAHGWERRFIYDDPRLSEAVETYRELGFEVRLLPVAPDDAECTECMLQEPDRYRVIYTRKR
ncbi:MAG: hypothetical protein JSW67_09730 [Candidatus Latescibacterota bacterium]|nr:MAG: hypothetical protein JSW67_09730 [Candidatus Latescibacterota bacterium]